MKIEFRDPQVKYVTEKGKPQAVILSIKDYERLLNALEDLRDLQSAERRRTEPTVEYSVYHKKRFAGIKSNPLVARHMLRLRSD